MKPVYENTDYNYPIYSYRSFSDLPVDLRARKNIDHYKGEIHAVMSSVEGYCPSVKCSYCPIHAECNDSLPIFSFFPELQEDYPKLFV